MSLLQDWLPPSPGNWTLIVNTFTYFPVVTAVQWLTAYYPMRKHVDDLVPEYSREAGLDAHGTPRTSFAGIHHDRPARHSPTTVNGKPHLDRHLRLFPDSSLPITKPANLY
ncbi:hypothetical protein VE04_06398 [Pseudogymnoascus sp. 24MN13]|nr:hypothetical protein VE04_06398 [Pseudogymnoascus sp. 24MN13]